MGRVEGFWGARVERTVDDYRSENGVNVNKISDEA